MADAPLTFDPIAEARRQWALRWSRASARDMAAVASLMRVQQVMLGSLNEALRPLDLTFARYEALMLLSFTSRGAMPLGKMGERLQVHRTSITNIVDRLERAGYVRRAGTSDRRSTLAEITEAGREAAAQATERLNPDRFALPGLKAGEVEQLLALLTKVRATFGDFERSGA